MKKLLFFLVLLAPLPGFAQLWSGVLDPTRAIDWTTAGISGGIPSGTWTQCGATLTPSGGDDTSNIQNALNACAANQFVLLSNATFNLNGTVNIPPQTVLRGGGANQTIIKANSTQLTVNQYAFTLGYANGTNASEPNFTRTTAITSSNAKGDTSVTVSSLPTGIATTDLVWIADLNAWDSTCGVLGNSGATTNLTPDVQCVTTANVVAGNGVAGGASSFAMDAPSANFGQRAAGQMNQITNIVGNTLTLKDPLHDSFRHSLPDWQPNFTYFQGVAIHPSTQPTHVYYMTTNTGTGGPNPCTSGGSAPTFPTNGTTVTDGTSSPQCVWQDAGAGTDTSPRLMYFVPAVNAGIENLQIQGINNLQWGNFQSLIYFNTCSACWVTGIEINRPIGFILKATYSYDGVVESNYFTSSWFHGSGSDSTVDLDTADTGFIVDNNIMERTAEIAFTDHGVSGNVIAYNYGVGQWGANSLNGATHSVLSHDAWPRFNLVEGNVLQTIGQDPIHGGNGFNTFYRNWSQGTNLICNPVSALGLNTGGTLILPAAPTVSTNASGGSTTYTYKVEAVVGGAQSPPSSGTSISNGPATLSGTVFNTITAPLIASTQSCLVYRTAGASSGLIGSIPCDGSSTLNDTGQAVQGLGILGSSSTYVATGTITCTPQGTFGAAGANGWLSQATNWPMSLDALSSSMNTVGNVHGSTNLVSLAGLISTTEYRQACSVCDSSCVAGGSGGSQIKCGNGSRVFQPSIVDESFGYTTSPPATPYDNTLAQDTVFRCENYYNSTGVVETGACASAPSLPPSFYLNSRPSWWKASLAFPAIGSDIVGGSAASFGFAKLIPAQNCFTNIMGGADGGAGSPLSFNAATCYPITGTTTPGGSQIQGPTQLRGSVQLH